MFRIRYLAEPMSVGISGLLVKKTHNWTSPNDRASAKTCGIVRKLPLSSYSPTTLTTRTCKDWQQLPSSVDNGQRMSCCHLSRETGSQCRYAPYSFENVRRDRGYVSYKLQSNFYEELASMANISARMASQPGHFWSGANHPRLTLKLPWATNPPLVPIIRGAIFFCSLQLLRRTCHLPHTRRYTYTLFKSSPCRLLLRPPAPRNPTSSYRTKSSSERTIKTLYHTSQMLYHTPQTLPPPCYEKTLDPTCHAEAAPLSATFIFLIQVIEALQLVA